MSKKTLEQLIREDRRLAILRLVNEATGKQMNSSILHTALLHIRIVVERHVMLDDLRFLQTHGLIDMEQSDVNAELYGIHLRGRGEDFLQGLFEIDGVSRPRRT